MEQQILKSGDEVWFWNHHIATNPCDCNTAKGFVLDACAAKFTDSDGDVVKYCKVQDCIGNQYTINALCVSPDDPRKTWKQEVNWWCE